MLRLAAAVVFAGLLAQPAAAAELVVQNDSTVGGTPSTVANFFIPGESTAAWLTASCSGNIVAARVYWASPFGSQPASLEQQITLYAGGSFPVPGGVLAQIPGPTLLDGVMNEYRFLDPPSDTVPLSVPITAGQVFVVSIQFLNQSSGNPFAPSVTYDNDGCQSVANAVDVLPGGWSDACPLGVTGDWVIRAVIDCAEPLPVASAWTRALMIAALLSLGAFTVAARRGIHPQG